MKELFSFLTMDHPILSALFIGSLIIELACIVGCVIVIRNKKTLGDMKVDKYTSLIGITMLIFIFIMAIAGHKLEVEENKLKVKEAQDISYTHAIKSMSEGQWYEAAIAFDNAGNRNNAEILRDYCYYIYISEEYPEWVPYMGLNDVIYTYNERRGEP